MLVEKATEELQELPVSEALLGDPEAWNVLFKRFELPLYVYVVELISDEQASLDIVQETFINATKHLGSLKEHHKIGSWLFAIAHQKCLQHWRKPRPDPCQEADLIEELFDPSESPSQWLIQREDEAEFMALLDRLPDHHRSVLLLHFLEGFSLDEIATITGATLGTVKSRMHYAKKGLRKLLTTT